MDENKSGGRYGRIRPKTVQEERNLLNHYLAELSGDWSLAKELSQKLTELDPINIDYWRLLAFANERLKRYSRAIDCYKHALAAEHYHSFYNAKKLSSIWLGLARCSSHNGQLLSALEQCEMAIQLSATFSLAHTLRAILLQRLRCNPDQILVARSNAIRCSPHNPQLYLARANHHANHSDFILAMQDMEQVNKTRQYTVNDRQTLSIILMGLGEYDTALEQILLVLKLSPNLAPARFNRGHCLVYLERYKEAYVAFLDCLSFPKLQIPALLKRQELAELIWNLTGDTRFLLSGIQDTHSLERLNQPNAPWTLTRNRLETCLKRVTSSLV